MSWKYVQYENGKYRTVENGGGGDVTSVNGQTGDVNLDAEDVGALPDDIPLFSGDYNDLINKPTIPAAQVNSDWDASSGVAEILNKPPLSVVDGKLCITYTTT